MGQCGHGPQRHQHCHDNLEENFTLGRHGSDTDAKRENAEHAERSHQDGMLDRPIVDDAGHEPQKQSPRRHITSVGDQR